MRKIVSTSTTKRKINQWLDRISTPNPKMEGLPICPYISKYRDSIHIAIVKDPERLARHFADVKDIFRLEACLAVGFYLTYEKMEQLVDTLNQELAIKDTVVLMMHPDGDEDVLPVDYQFDLPIMIIQRASTLQKAQEELSKTNYYKHYKY
jgi:hypothetical protein